MQPRKCVDEDEEILNPDAIGKLTTDGTASL
jgi:hypothetical protein